MTDIKVLYIDNHILVLDKPAGLATQESEHHPDSLENDARLWVKTEFNRTGNVFLHALHRLDTPVSGAVLFARTDKALSRLNQSIRDKKHRKIYLAVTEKIPAKKSGTLKHFHSHHRFMAKITDAPHEGSKEAVLSYEVLTTAKGMALVRVELVTGRYHQIRAQLAHIGAPIFGDEKYGSKNRMDGRVALHHAKLSFTHPVTKENMTIVSPLPDYYPFSLFSSPEIL